MTSTNLQAAPLSGNHSLLANRLYSVESLMTPTGVGASLNVIGQA